MDRAQMVDPDGDRPAPDSMAVIQARLRSPPVCPPATLRQRRPNRGLPRPKGGIVPPMVFP
jgi:hypothetical protein